MSAYDSMMQGLNEALEYAGGKEAGAKVHRIEVGLIEGRGDPCQPEKPE